MVLSFLDLSDHIFASQNLDGRYTQLLPNILMEEMEFGH